MIPLWYTESELPSFPRLTDNPPCVFLRFLDPLAHPWALGALPLLLVSCSGRAQALLSPAQGCYKNTVRGEMELHLPFEFSKDFKLIVEAMVPENKLTRRGGGWGGEQVFELKESEIFLKPHIQRDGRHHSRNDLCISHLSSMLIKYPK